LRRLGFETGRGTRAYLVLIKDAGQVLFDPSMTFGDTYSFGWDAGTSKEQSGVLSILAVLQWRAGRCFRWISFCGQWAIQVLIPGVGFAESGWFATIFGDFVLECPPVEMVPVCIAEVTLRELA